MTIGLSARPLIKQLEAEEIQKLSFVRLRCGGREGKIEMNDRVKSAHTTPTMKFRHQQWPSSHHASKLPEYSCLLLAPCVVAYISDMLCRRTYLVEYVSCFFVKKLSVSKDAHANSSAYANERC